MSKICIIGEQEFVFCFKMFGVSIFPVVNEKEAEDALVKAVSDGFSIIYLTETYIEKIESKIETITKMHPVSIIIIPGQGELKDLGWRKLRKTVEKAIGADLLKDPKPLK